MPKDFARAQIGAEPQKAPDNPKNQVQSVAKAFAVLQAFGRDLPALTVAEIAGRAELDRGTAFRLIHTLVGLGYLRAVPDSRRFRLTLKCLELGFSALAASDLPGHATPLLRELVPGVADAGSLGVLDRGEVIYLARVDRDLGTPRRRPPSGHPHRRLRHRPRPSNHGLAAPTGAGRASRERGAREAR